MGPLKDIAAWAAGELVVIWFVVRALVEMFIFWLRTRVPSLRAPLLAKYGRRCRMPPFAGDWQVRECSVIFVNANENCCGNLPRVIKCQTPSKRRTNGQTKRRVSWSVVSVRGVLPMGERTAMLHRNLKGRDGSNPGSTNYTKFGQFIIRKI